MAAWSTQTQLGRTVGLTARQVGARLTELGLKAGAGVSDAATTQGLAKKATMRDGTEFYVWSTDEVVALLGGATTSAPAATGDHSAFDHVYATDGSAIRNPGPTGWAWVNQRTGETGAGGLPHGTNNIGELLALQRALEHVGPDGDLLVRADSRYVINIATTWGRGWKKRGWKKADGKTPESLDIVKAILTLVDARTGRTEFEWVKGHAGDTFNEIVDRLAGEQARAAG